MFRVLLLCLVFTTQTLCQSAGDCLCFVGSGVNVRDGPCGDVIGSSSDGHCFIATGASTICDLSGSTYNFYEFQFGLGTGWTANDYLVTSPGNCVGCGQFTLVTREEWGARSPTSVTPLSPTNKYFVHHSEGSACNDLNECAAVVRGIQDWHMDGNGWSDIGYNFLVGEDGRAYEGRGWDVQGAHASNWNSESHGICIMGTFDTFLPNQAAMNTTQHLMQCGISQEFVSSAYTLHGHRDGTCTSCPGDALYNEISTWPNFGGSLPGGCSDE